MVGMRTSRSNPYDYLTQQERQRINTNKTSTKTKAIAEREGKYYAV